MAGQAREVDGELDSADVPRFLADSMLGRLARYLRFLGYDTAYEADIPDSEFVLWARRERRILLTRDRALVKERRPQAFVVLESDTPLEQLRGLARRFGLELREPSRRRRTLCNELLELATDAQVLTDLS